MSFRVLVTGSRTWTDKEAILAAFRKHANKAHTITVVHGACPKGADALADELAQEFGVPVERHPADWSIGKQAGFRRNAEMVAAGADVCLAFIHNNSKGATHTADLAEKAGIPTYRYTTED